MHALRRLISLACATMALGAASGAIAQSAQAYPASPVRIIIPTPPGGGNDILARLVGQKLTAAWGQPVIVESKPGASGMIAASFVAKAPPDGYTLLVTHAAIATAVALRKAPTFRLNEVTPVAQLAITPIAFTVNASTGANDLAQFIKAAKANPKRYSFGSYGVGTTAHLFGEALNKREGIDMAHVPYKGEAPAVQDLIGGQLTAVFGTAGLVEPHVKTGKVKVLAVAGPRRLTLFPDVPTFAEAGYPEINLPGWIAVMAPAATPRDIVDKLSREIGLIVRMPEVAQKMIEMGYEPTGTGALAFGESLAAELKQWEALGKETGVSLD